MRPASIKFADAALGVAFMFAFAVTLAACASSRVDYVPYDPTPNNCVKIEATSFWSSAAAFPCFDSEGKPITAGRQASGGAGGAGGGFYSVSTTTPASAAASVVSGAANAAVLSAVLPELLPGQTTNVKTSK